MYDGDLEEHSQQGIRWNQSVALFLGLVAVFGLGYAAVALWQEARLPNGRELWHGLAVSSVLVAAGAVAMWRRSLVVGFVLVVFAMVFFGVWMPDR
ncbi:MAG TPA: hypothetical protein VFV87_10110 [Pirellulaceae bacterium]|nr:hypothetical protein [Pirellulaceae bacterium]